MKYPFQLSYSTKNTGEYTGLFGWRTKVVKTFSALIDTMKNYPYSSSVFANSRSRRNQENVEKLANAAIFDIDNEEGKPRLTLKDAEAKLRATGYPGLIMTSRSHQKSKIRPSGETSPAVDRYRIVVPLQDTIEYQGQKDVYREYMREIGDQLGLTDYVDTSALNDVARMYYPSPEDAVTIKINGNNVIDNKAIWKSAERHIENIRRIEAEAEEERRKERILSMKKAADSLHTVHSEKLELLDMMDVIAAYEGAGDESREGHYTYYKVEGGGKYSIVQDGAVAYDWKEMQGYNVYSYLRKHDPDGNYIERMRRIGEKLNISLVELNLERIRNVVEKGLETAKNEGKDELEKYVKNAFKGVNYVKFDMKAETLTIAEETVKFVDIGQSRVKMIERFTENRRGKGGIGIDR